MFELNLIIIAITYIVVAGGVSQYYPHFYCANSAYQRCLEGESFQYPFYGGVYSSNSSSDNCGYPGFEIHCNSHNGRPMINISDHLYYVLKMDIESQKFSLVDVEVEEEECPRPTHNLTLQTTSVFALEEYQYSVIYFYNCSSASGYPEKAVQRLPCLNTYYNHNTTPGLRSFAFDGYVYAQSEGCVYAKPEGFAYAKSEGYNWFTNCQKNVVVPVSSRNNYSDFTQDLKSGFTITWTKPRECYSCEISGGYCLYNQTDGAPPLCSCKYDTKLYHGSCPRGLTIGQKFIIGICVGTGGLLLFILFIYRKRCASLCCSTVSLWKSKVKTPTNVEVFLESVGCFGLLTYKYSEIKKITNSFKETLGQGGFGSVYKGRLQDGRLVAVKVLNELKGNGEDFINEVATIGRTNHINVVSLLGFCSSGTKRALVYEFMPNGSLENFIYDQENASITNPHLGWEKLYKIALGIAKGLEYLHHGCNTRILHFDIKPHNILLDQDFCPKITDFGLAKLCLTRESVISMIGGRGTTGYIAPEVGNRIFGGVSHKSDVYSYGMMVLEMLGGRKNMDLKRENMSEIYFPLWIYNHFQRQDMNMDDCGDIYQEETTKKMITVALWCIQTQPTDRPSISKVVEMLEGNIEELQMPPNPFQNPPSRSSP